MFRPPRPVIRLMSRQLGVVARRQLRRWCEDKRIDGRVRHGHLERIERGVYRAAHSDRLVAQEPFAAALRAGPGAVVPGPFVLAHLRVDGFAPGDPFEVLVSPGRHVTGVDFRVRPQPDLPRRASIAAGEIRLANPCDALVDSGRFREQIGDRRLRLAYDWLRWRGSIGRGCSPGDRILELAGHDAGARALLEVLGGDEDPDRLWIEAESERRRDALVSRFDPPPERQVYVTLRRRLDDFFRLLRFALEYLGTVDHATLLGRTADAARDEELQAQGIAVYDVRAEDLRDPEALLGGLSSALTIRAYRLGVTAPALRPA